MYAVSINWVQRKLLGKKIEGRKNGCSMRSKSAKAFWRKDLKRFQTQGVRAPQLEPLAQLHTVAFFRSRRPNNCEPNLYTHVFTAPGQFEPQQYVSMVYGRPTVVIWEYQNKKKQVRISLRCISCPFSPCVPCNSVGLPHV